MKRRTMAAVVVIVVLVFFFVPVVPSTFHAGPAGFHLTVTVYRSISCVALNIGMAYSPDWFGWYGFGPPCLPPPPF